MHNTLKNLLDIENNIKTYLNKLKINNKPKIIAVSKTFKIEKWTDIKKKNLPIKLHMIGKLQTNKVKYAVRIFDYIHSVDSIKLAKKIADEQKKINKKIKVFLQINIGDEHQKSGIIKSEASHLVAYCKEIGLDLIGLMCIPPVNIDSNNYFKEMNKLNNSFGFVDLSMGMSSDYLVAAKNFATYVRIGSSIFGNRY